MMTGKGLLLCLLLQVVFASKDELSCETERQSIISNFLASEKGRTFANKIADWDELRLSLNHVRWLPTFFEEQRFFSHFFLLEGNFTAEEANDACQRLDGGQLASLHTAERMEFVNKHLVAGNYWIGLHRWAGCPVFLWSNGQPLGDSNLHWQTSEPRPHDQHFDCVRTVTPPDMVCNMTFCKADTFATWATERCDGETKFAALCETKYPRPLYGLLPGKFDWKSAQEACKMTFGQAVNSGLAMPKTWAHFENMVNGVNLHSKKWHCWVGMQRTMEQDVWKHKWVDGTWATRFSHQPRLNRTYSAEHTCVEVYDRYYSEEQQLPGQAWFHYNDCEQKLDCAICEWAWPF